MSGSVLSAAPVNARCFRALRAAFAAVLASSFGAAAQQPGEPGGNAPPETEIPISVPTPIPVGFSIAWKPTILSVRADSGVGTEFGSDKFQPLRGLARYTTTWLGEKLLARAEIEGGQFQTETENIGTQGWDVTFRLLGGTATRLSQKLAITASAGLLTRYQHGRAENAAPNFGVLGLTSNIELEYRLAPVIAVSVYFEGGIGTLAYGSQENLGGLSDSSELRWRLQISFDLTPTTAVDVGYDFTRWHASFNKSNLLQPSGPPNQALLLEAREHAVSLSLRFKP